MKKTASAIALVALALASFQGLPAAAQPDTGSADFTRYVALGDSLTAAIVSAGWLEKFQRNSYPALINRQAKGGDAGFQQPLMSAPGITPPLALVNLVPPRFASAPGLGVPINLNLPRPYDNLGIPGARAGDLLRKLTDGGGPFDLVLRGQGPALAQGLALRPTFVSLWIGNNDALAAATSGRAIDGVTLTTAAAFEADYRAIAAALDASGADLLFVNLPNVTAIPFVTTIPPVVVNPATSRPVLGPNGQPIPLLGPNGGPLAANDFVLLTASSLLAQGIGIPRSLGGTGLPLPDQVVLDATEAARIVARVQAFNAVIRQVATEVGAAFFDLNAFFEDVRTDGVHLAGITYNAAFLTGGVFSYDGVHATPFGYAYVANEMIDVINDFFDAEIPKVSLGPWVFGANQLDPRAVTFVAGAAAASTVLEDSALVNMRFLGMEIPTFAATTPGGGKGGNKGGDEGSGGDNGHGGGGDGGETAGGEEPASPFERPGRPPHEGDRAIDE